MAARGLVLAFYQDRDVALGVLNELRSHRYYRSAAILTNSEGKVEVVRVGKLPGSRLPKDVIAHYTRWMLRNESLVLVHTASMTSALQTLRHTAGAVPATFCLLNGKKHAAPATDEFRPLQSVSIDALRTEAARLANTHLSTVASPIHTRLLTARLKDNQATLSNIHDALSTAVSLDQPVSMSAEWLLDNAYILQGQIDDLRRELPTRYYDRLPRIVEGPEAGLPRVYAIANRLISEGDTLFDSERLTEFLHAYQDVSRLTMGELWALPIMLRLRMIECVRRLAEQVARRERETEQADFLANRLLTAARQDRDRLLPLVAEIGREHPAPSAYLADQLVSYLYDEDSALSALRGWLEYRLGAALAVTSQQEHLNQTTELAALANAITALRQFAQFDWQEIFESLSDVEAVLRTDPSGIYPRMDFATRDEYRHVVEDISRRSGCPEREVAVLARELAAQGSNELTRHVGYFLQDAGRGKLEVQTNFKPGFAESARRKARATHTITYLGSAGLLTACFVSFLLIQTGQTGASPIVLVTLCLLTLLPASELAIQILNYLITRMLPPHRLPRMEFEDGIPEQYRTLVVVPMMLFSPQGIAEEAANLEIRYLANPDANLCFGLLSDFSDAEQKEMPDDIELLEVAVNCIEKLNEKYTGGRFFLFHREREWSESEGRWIGRERKRGKLEQLNRYLAGDLDSTNSGRFLRSGDLSELGRIRFVITLDSDTQLPRETARHLVETLAHPLNQAHISPDERGVERGYTIIQPTVKTSLPSATATRFSRLFTDATGIDPYTHVNSDVYQDLVGESSYQGKGIYDVETFHRLLSSRFPESHVLSHDLLEGGHVRVGFATDIELLDQFPGDYAAYRKRRHRWTRGDWQIADWLLNRVPDGNGKVVSNSLSSFNRWKIADNLRRSLLPAVSIGLLTVAWLIAPNPIAYSVFIAAVLLLPAITQAANSLLDSTEIAIGKSGVAGATVVRALVTASLMPDEAWSSLDAIIRVWYRRLISHRLLLQWETAQAAYRSAYARQRVAIRMIAPALCLTVASVLLVLFKPAARPAAIPYLALWLASPGIVAWLNHLRRSDRTSVLTADDRQMLRILARQTWRYFDDFTGPDTNWLPPDNHQVELRLETAQRTSPTNIGMGLLATLAAHDFGYLSADNVVERSRLAMETIGKLERFEGHLLNWYDIRTLEPLMPRYISMVDTGNLLGCAWAMAQGIEELISAPVLCNAALGGLKDTLSNLRPLQAVPTGRPDLIEKPLRELEDLVNRPGNSLAEVISSLRAASTPACILLKVVNDRYAAGITVYWAAQVDRQVSEWNRVIDRYLSWVEVLQAPPEEGLLACSADAHEWRRQALASEPSLSSLASEDVPGLRELVGLSRRTSELNIQANVRSWLDSLAEAAAAAQHVASEQLNEAQNVTVSLQRLTDETNMRYLYDEKQHQFHTGYNISNRRMDSGCFNLLASEARLGSFVCIARGEIPVEHWWALGRPFGSIDGENVLLSWGGTMFEYLMPLLLQRSYENSMLDSACSSVVMCQIAYGRKRNIPWGISESAYSAVDMQRTYQYRAFGVPGLGLKRGLSEDLVVSPYSSALALAVDPVAAVKNLRRLATLRDRKMRDGYGFYEAIDYTRQQDVRGRRGVVVRSFMAHHQGMILTAIDNALNGDILRERFHRDRRVRATESLLYERIPAMPAISQYSAQKQVARKLPTLLTSSPRGRIDTPNTPCPQANLLSNGAYSVMVTNSGAGYSQWKDLEITRWRADSTRDASGSFCYIKSIDDGAVWSAGHQPVRADAQSYRVVFAPDKTEIFRRDGEIDTVTEIAVSPEDNVEVRRITLLNRSRQKREFELTSYMEIALASHLADRAHPAFSKLFVQTEYLPVSDALIAWRRPRVAPSEEAQVWAFHVAASEYFESSAEYETDRDRFIGRCRTLANPVSMQDNLFNSVGAVLDPIFALRRKAQVDPGQRVSISFVTGAANSREEAIALTEKYRLPRSTDRVFEMAWTQSQLDLRHLRIHQAETQYFQQLASLVLYPTSMLRPGPERLTQNTLGQAALWAHGISGDLPIVVATIEDERDIGLIRELLMAHTFWQARGLKVDLIVLNEEPAGYERPVRQLLEKVMDAYSSTTNVARSGRVILLGRESVSAADRTLLLTTARAVLVAARGGLADQLSAPAVLPSLAPPIPVNARVREEPSSPLPFMELLYFNGFGGFTQDGTEYVIYLGPNRVTPMPWSNVMSNPSFGALVTESGSGFCWCENSQSNRLTPWSNDPITDPCGDALYIRDDEMGKFWSPTPLPIREQDAYRTRHGFGYTVAEHNSHAIEQELTTFVPVDESGGAPLKLQRLRLRNRSSRKRTLTITHYCEWVLGADREDTQMHVGTQWDAAGQLMLAFNPYHPEHGRRAAFVGTNMRVTSYTGDRTEFLGRNGDVAKPAAVKRTRLSGRVGAGLDPCSAIQVSLELRPDEQVDVIFLLGQAENAAAASDLCRKYRSPDAFEAALQRTRRWWSAILQIVQIQTPDKGINLLLNGWLLYQDLSCRFWGRSAYYQSGGAFGFRDQLQDVMALVYSAPNIAREHILRTAQRQFAEGDVQHWWHPSSGAGVRTRISDDMLWLPYVTAHYVQITNDKSILDETVPFLDAKPLDTGEHEAYFTPGVSGESASLLEHCRRAIVKGLTSGPHGLPLIGTGDWSDGLNRVGIGGKGESVWLAWFLIDVMNGFADLLDPESSSQHEAEFWRKRSAALAAVAESQGWDGTWYRRAYYDDGTPIGSTECDEAQIDSMAQSWAVLCGAANPERARTAMLAAEKQLVRRDNKLVLLFTPPFDKSQLDPGYIKGYPPGVRENGGQYTHGSLWVPMAFARMGEGDKAVDILRMMNPIEHARNEQEVDRYRTEPYVTPGDVYALSGSEGRGGWTWYTGSASWMYRIWLEEVVGFQLRGKSLRFDPCIASAWTGVSLQYRFGTAQYNIEIENPANCCRGVSSVELDGSIVPDQTVHLTDDGSIHQLRVVLGGA